MKKVYLQNGVEAELITSFKDNKTEKYVVKEIIEEEYYNEYEGQYNEPIYETKIVNKIWEKYEDVPLLNRKTKLEQEIEMLEAEIDKLRKQRTSLIDGLKNIFLPEYKIGDKIYMTIWGNEVREVEIHKIIFEVTSDKQTYTYWCGEYKEFERLGEGYYKTKKEAEKARQDYLTSSTIEKMKNIKEQIKELQEEYKNLQLKNKFNKK